MAFLLDVFGFFGWLVGFVGVGFFGGVGGGVSYKEKEKRRITIMIRRERAVKSCDN